MNCTETNKDVIFLQLLALAVALCVALAYAEPEPEAWGGHEGYDGGYRRVGIFRGGFYDKFGGGYYVRKKRSADPEPVAKPAAEPGPCCFGGSRRFVYGGGFGGSRGGISRSFRGIRGGFKGKYYGRKKRSSYP